MPPFLIGNNKNECFDMFNRLIFAFALCIQSCFALAAADDWAAQRELRHKAAREAYAQEVLGMTQSEAAAVVNAAYDSSTNKVTQTFKKTGVSEDGSKITASATIKQTPNKTKVAQVLTERLKNAKDYAKNVGKASIPTFVGMAAFHGLMEGIGWVMDEGGEVKKTSPDSDYQNDVQPYHQYYYVLGNYWGGGGGSVDNYCRMTDLQYKPKYNNITSAANATVHCWEQYNQKSFGPYSITPNGATGFNLEGQSTLQIIKIDNPSYNSDSQVPSTNIDPEEIQIALQQALLNNNAMQAAMIAEAIKSAYSPDSSPGQKLSDPASNSLALDAANDAKNAIKNAAQSDPTPQGSGYYRLEDHETGKVIEGYVTPAPTGGTTGSTTTPQLDLVTGQPTGGTSSSGSFEFPAFCDWAGIVCEWIDWTKQPPEEEEKEQPEPPSDQGIFDWSFDTDFNLSGQCPPDFSFTWTNKYFAGTHTISLNWLCIIFTFLGYPLVFLSHCIGIWILYEVASRKEIKTGY